MALLIYKLSIPYFMIKYYFLEYAACRLSLIRLCSLVAVLIEYDKKGKSTTYSSQTVFHNVCSEHAVLFLCLYHFVSKGATKAATPNCVPQSIVRARHTPYKRYFIMFVRSTPCSSCVCVILSVKTATKAAHLTAFLLGRELY